MHIPGLTDALIRERTAGGSYERGQEYLEKGAVQHIEHSRKEVNARVKGSHYIPYAVHITYNAQGITDVECTCPYHEGTWCKHVVATLLTVLRDDTEPPREGVTDRLDTLSRDELIVLIERMVEADPELRERIESELDDLEE